MAISSVRLLQTINLLEWLYLNSDLEKELLADAIFDTIQAYEKVRRLAGSSVAELKELPADCSVVELNS
jgi:hypothetical protein